MADGAVIGTGLVKLTADGKQMTSTISGELGKLGGPLGQLGMLGQKAGGLIGKGMDSSRSAIAGVGVGLAVVGIAAAAFAVKAASAFVDYGKQVLKVQRYLGDSAQSASKWAFAATQSGVDTDKFASSVGKLEKGLASGSINLDKLGIASLDAHGKLLPMDNILLNIADKVKAAAPGIDRVTLAQKLFGKSGADLVPILAKGSEGIKALGVEAQKYGLVLTGSNLDAIKKSIAAHREQTAAMQGLQVQIGSQVLPVMTKLTTTLTSGLLAVMPAISAVVRDGVVPAFSLLASVVGGATRFLSDHSGAAAALGAVIGSVLVPALGIYVALQVKAMALKFGEFLMTAATGAQAAAQSLGLVTGSLEGGTLAMTGFGIAATGGLAALGLLVGMYLSSKASAKQWADDAVKGATSVQDSLNRLAAAQDAEAKKTGLEGKGWESYAFAAVGAIKGVLDHHSKLDEADKKRAQILKDQADAAKATATAETQASDQISQSLTSQGLAMQSLGGTTKLTSDQILQLAGSMNIDLTKAQGGQIEALTAQAGRLAITSEGALKLSDANKVLGDWTQDVTKKTAAYTAALDSLINANVTFMGGMVGEEQALADLGSKLTKGKDAINIHTQAGRDNETELGKVAAALSQASSETYKHTGSVDAAKQVLIDGAARLDAIATAAHLTKDQVAQVRAEYGLTPAAIASVNPAVDASAGAFGNLANNIGSAGANLAQFVANAKQDLGNIAKIAPAINSTAAGINAGAAATLSGTYKPPGGSHAHAAGGIIDKHEFAELGEGNRREVVLPVTDAARSRQLIAQAGIENLFPRPAPGTYSLASGASSSTTVVHHHNQTIVNVHVAGSVVTEGQLVQKVRLGLDKYNSRNGSGR